MNETECDHPVCRTEINGRCDAMEKDINDHEILLRGEDKKSGVVFCIKDKINKGAFWLVASTFGVGIVAALAIVYGIALSGPTKAECKDNADEIVNLKVSVGKIEKSSENIEKNTDKMTQIMEQLGIKIDQCEKGISDNKRDIENLKEKYSTP